uniref:Uncharacterized protein n=1 Tax=Arundo donax TaxID=35708 RepID=A0A0A9ELU2_ARUDO
MSRWMIRCLQNICRYCNPLATPTAILYLTGHSRIFPLFPCSADARVPFAQNSNTKYSPFSTQHPRR